MHAEIHLKINFHVTHSIIAATESHPRKKAIIRDPWHSNNEGPSTIVGIAYTVSTQEAVQLQKFMVFIKQILLENSLICVINQVFEKYGG